MLQKISLFALAASLLWCPSAQGQRRRGSSLDPDTIRALLQRSNSSRFRGDFSSRDLERLRALLQRGSGFSTTTGATAGNASPNRKPEPKPKPTGPQVTVDLLLVELATADSDKQPLPVLSGDIRTVEKTLADLKQHGRLRSRELLSLTTLDGQKATTQFGESRPRVSSTAAFGGGRGRPTRSYSYRQYGTLVTITPTVEPGGTVLVDLQFEKSGPQAAAEVREEGETALPPGSSTTSIRGVQRLTAGKYAVVTSSTRKAGSATERLVLLAAVRVEAVPHSKPTAEAGPQTVVIPLHNAVARSLVPTLESIFDGGETRIVADERTNSLLVKGPPKVLHKLEDILQQLDRPAAAK